MRSRLTLGIEAVHGAGEGHVERDLVERAQGGDRDAFGILAGASIARLYNLAQLMLADSDLAEDAVQEALIVTWRDLRALRDPNRFDSWIHRILVRCVYRVARSERRRIDRLHLSESHEASTPDTSGDFENRDEIDRGFRRLKAEYRAVLVVHHYLGLSDDDAAELLGLPPGTFKSRLNRATAAMRAALDADARRDERPVAETIR
jgi:RNA polymerase sigma factor (sigma-70 family)